MNVFSQDRSPQLPYSAAFLAQQASWFFFFKPSGLHTVRAGKKGGGHSLEDDIFHILPKSMTQEKIILCTRLDEATSGIVVGAQDIQMHDLWRHMEQHMQIQKKYIALVKSYEAMPSRTWTIPFAIDMNKRKISKVLNTEAESRRHTHFQHLHTLTQDACERLVSYAHTQGHYIQGPQQREHIHLVGCTLFQGARHQIRAHAAYASAPLWNDVRYAERRIPVSKDFFFLHHGGLFLPHAHIAVLPDWIFVMSKRIQKDVFQFFHTKEAFF